MVTKTIQVEKDGKYFDAEVSTTGNTGHPMVDIVCYRFYGDTQRDVLEQVVQWLKKEDDPSIGEMSLQTFYVKGKSRNIAFIYRQEPHGFPFCSEYDMTIPELDNLR